MLRLRYGCAACLVGLSLFATQVRADDKDMSAAEMLAGNGTPVTGMAMPVAVTASVGAPVNGALPLPSRLLVVEIRASGNWKETCRQSVKLAERYQGNAGLRLQLAGQDLVMDFPDRRIDCAIELVEALERLPGVGRVYEC